MTDFKKSTENDPRGMVVDFKFKNGQRVRDIVSGVEGIIDSAAYWLNGCKRYSVQPKASKGSERPDSWWIDEEQLEVVDEGIHVKPSKTGGPSFKSTNARF